MSMNFREAAKSNMDYVRIRKAEIRDPEQIRRSLQKGYRVEHPERIMGYPGLMYDPGDVYVSGQIAERMGYEEFRSFVMDSLRRFDHEDYGQISLSDRDENIENRCLFGIDRLFGRYGFHNPARRRNDTDPFDEVICVRKYGENTWVTTESEVDWFVFLKEKDLKKAKDITETDWYRDSCTDMMN